MYQRYQNRATGARDNPVCFDKVSNTSGPIACSRRGGVTGLLGPVPTQDSAVSRFAMAALLKTLHEFAAQEPAGTGTGETPAQLAEQAADATLAGSRGRTLSNAAKHFGDPKPVDDFVNMQQQVA